MIGAMRRFARSKWALVLLFIPLVIALAVTLPDTFGGGLSGGTLFRAGDREVKGTEVRREIDRAIRRVLIDENRVVSLDEAVTTGMAQREFLNLEYQSTLLAFADKMGIRASAEALKPYLERNQVLTNAFGQVDQLALQREAQDRGMSRAQFEAFLQDFLTQRYVEIAAMGAINMPEVLSEPFIKYFGQTRTLSLARPTQAILQNVAQPTDEELQAWFDKNKDRFAQPERRRISALVYTPDDLLARTSFTDEQVREYYEANIKTYSTPESRVIVEYKSPDRNVVQAFVDLAAQGIPVEEALAQSPGIEVVERTVLPEQIENEDYRTVLFQMQPGKLDGRALQLAEGQPYFTMMVKSVTPGTPTPLADIMERVRRDQAFPEARRLFEESSEPFRDAAGQPLEDLASQFGTTVQSFEPVDASGRTAKGEALEILTGNRDAMTDLFKLTPGQMTTIFEDEDKLSMFRLDEIVAPYTPTFADLKDTVKQIVLAERQLAAMDAAANAMVAAVKDGTAYAQAATANKLEALPAITVTRQGGQQIDQALVTASFELKEGEVALVRGSKGEPWVARVDAIMPTTPEAAAILKFQLGNQISQSLQQDFSEVFQRGLEKEVEVKRDDEALQRFFQGMRARDTGP